MNVQHAIASSIIATSCEYCYVCSGVHVVKSYIAKLRQLAESNKKVKRLLELYGSAEIRVELDALVALKPDEFKKVLKAAIEKYFDYNVYNTVTKAKEEELKKKAEQVKTESLENLKKLLGQQ